jgi:hypothetical protein
MKRVAVAVIVLCLVEFVNTKSVMGQRLSPTPERKGICMLSIDPLGFVTMGPALFANCSWVNGTRRLISAFTRVIG